jgi:UDP-glucose 4-epimerase
MSLLITGGLGFLGLQTASALLRPSTGLVIIAQIGHFL